MRVRPLWEATLAAALVAVPATTAAADAPRSAPVVACAAANAVPTAGATAARASHSLLCLLNRERARAGLPRLRSNDCLARAAGAHARDMVRRRYFAHTAPDGRGLAQRVLATGYAPRFARWTIGEDLAWGIAPRGDPAWAIRAWMHSPEHRANVLRRAFRDVGVAAVPGAPVRTGHGASTPRATYAVEFGVHGPGPTPCT